MHQCRRSEFNDWEGIISSYPLVNCANGYETLFLQFNTSINVGNKLQKIIIGFGHPDLINIIKGGPVHLFIDCTFKCVPKGFSQCLVITHRPYKFLFFLFCCIRSWKKFIPWHFIWVSNASTEFMMEIIKGSVDFEKGLVVNAIKRNFEGKPVTGCEFHWKQAIRRKLFSLGIPDEVVTVLMKLVSSTFY